MERKGICNNVGVCTMAGKVQVITDDDAEFKCTECGEELEACKEEPIPVGPNPKKKWIVIALAILLLGGIGFGLYKLFGGPKGPTGTFIFKKKGKNVEVTSGGEVTALKKGEATILVKCEENPDIRALCKVTIEGRDTTPPPTDTVLVKQLSIDGGDFSIKVGESKQLSYIVTPEKHDELLSWTSDNETVATVDNTGKVSAIKKGTATIKVAADKSGTNATVKVTVIKGGELPPTKSPIERYGKYSGGRAKSNGYPDGTGKLTFTKSYQLNAQYTAQPGEYIQGIFENGKPTFVTYYQKDGTVTKIKLR